MTYWLDSPKVRLVLALTALIFILIGIYAFYADRGHKAQIGLNAPRSVGTNTEFRVPLYISTGVAANAGEFYFTFPKDKLDVKSIDTTGSIFQLWITNFPKFSNADGTIQFAGGLPKPGFTGKNGLVATIVFTAKSTGPATISLDSTTSRLLANDGQGTKIDSFYQPVTINIK